VCPLFLLDSVDAGGLDMTTAQIGLVQGSVGIIGLTLGGILGGVVVARHGFGRWLWPMVAGISLPNVVYILLAYFQPDSTPIVGVCVFVEQFGYGFGFTAYMLYLIYFSQGAEATSHYAFCTGVMALSLMLPGMVAGWLQERVGYLNFFIIVMALIPITFLVSALIRVEKDFGRKDE
jgi:PAT family beta-lactamase induction signal transducer AmpG